MKQAYVKPVVAKRQLLSSVTAVLASAEPDKGVAG